MSEVTEEFLTLTCTRTQQPNLHMDSLMSSTFVTSPSLNEKALVRDDSQLLSSQVILTAVFVFTASNFLNT